MRSQRAELLKLSSLPAIWITLVATTGGSAIVALALRANDERAGGHAATEAILAGVPKYAVVGVAVCGVLASTSEYATRQVSRSLLSVPARGVLLATKGLAACAALLLMSIASMTVSHMAISTDPTPATGRTVVLASVHLTVMGAICTALGMLLRQLVGTLTAALFALVIAPPILASLTPWGRWLPSEAGLRIVTGVASSDDSLVLASLAVLTWLIALWLAAAIRFFRSDA